MAQVLAPEVELVLVVAPSGDQARDPRAPVSAGGDSSLPDSGLGGDQVAVGGLDRWCSLVG